MYVFWLRACTEHLGPARRKVCYKRGNISQKSSGKALWSREALLWWRSMLLNLTARSIPLPAFLSALLGKKDGAGIVPTSVALQAHLSTQERSVQVVPATACCLSWAGLAWGSQEINASAGNEYNGKIKIILQISANKVKPYRAKV